jgi:hypothetical protein
VHQSQQTYDSRDVQSVIGARAGRLAPSYRLGQVGIDRARIGVDLCSQSLPARRYKHTGTTGLSEPSAGFLIASSGAVWAQLGCQWQEREIARSVRQQCWEIDHFERSSEGGMEFNLERDPSSVTPIDSCHEHQAPAL